MYILNRFITLYFYDKKLKMNKKHHNNGYRCKIIIHNCIRLFYFSQFLAIYSIMEFDGVKIYKKKIA